MNRRYRPTGFSMAIYDTQSTAQFRKELQGLACHVRTSTVLPGGCERCSFRLYLPTRPVLDYLDTFFELRVADEQGIFWLGRLEDIFTHRGPDGEWWDITAYGIGVNLDDQMYHGTEGNANVQNTQSSQAVLNAITDLTQKINSNNVTASSFTFQNTAAINLKLMTAAKVANMMAQYGIGAGTSPVIWTVYPQDDGDAEFVWKARATAAELEANSEEFESFDAGIMAGQLANKVAVAPSTSGVVTSRQDTSLQGAFPTGWGVIKTLAVIHPEITHATDAARLGDAILQLVKEKKMGGRGAVLSNAAYVKDVDSASTSYLSRVPLHRIRAGRLMKLTDIDSADVALTSLSYNNAGLIAQTEFDEDSQLLRVTFETLDRRLEHVVALSREVLSGRHTA